MKLRTNLLRNHYTVYLFRMTRTETSSIKHLDVTTVAATLTCPCLDIVMTLVVSLLETLSTLHRVIGLLTIETFKYLAVLRTIPHHLRTNRTRSRSSSISSGTQYLLSRTAKTQLTLHLYLHCRVELFSGTLLTSTDFYLYFTYLIY